MKDYGPTSELKDMMRVRDRYGNEYLVRKENAHDPFGNEILRGEDFREAQKRYEYEKEEAEWKQAFRYAATLMMYFLVGLTLFAIVSSLTSCSTKKTIVAEQTAKVVVDSISKADSVWHTENVKQVAEQKVQKDSAVTQRDSVIIQDSIVSNIVTVVDTEGNVISTNTTTDRWHNREYYNYVAQKVNNIKERTDSIMSALTDSITSKAVAVHNDSTATTVNKETTTEKKEAWYERLMNGAGYLVVFLLAVLGVLALGAIIYKKLDK